MWVWPQVRFGQSPPQGEWRTLPSSHGPQPFPSAPSPGSPASITHPPHRRAKPGRFGSLAFAMKNRHFGGECSWIPAKKARKCGRFWVFACVPNPGRQSIWRQCPPSARKQSTKKLPNRPGFAHVHPPLALLCNALGEGGPGWRGPRVLEHSGVQGEVPPSGIGARPTSRA